MSKQVQDLSTGTVAETSEIIMVDAGSNEMKKTTAAEIAGLGKTFTELTGTTWDGSNKYKTLTANLSLTLSGTKTAGLLYIAGNSSYTLTINGTAITINNTGDSIVGYIKQNGTYVISTDLSPVAIGAPDVTAPTVVSATAIDANTIRIVFSESMGAVTTAGHSFKQNGSTITPDSVSGATTTWDFVFSETMIDTDTLLRTYNSGTGATTDVAGNELASYTDQAVTNSITAAEVPLNFTSALPAPNFYLGGYGGIDILSRHAASKITVAGTATKVKFYLQTIPSEVTELFVSVWRLDGATYDRVGTKKVLTGYATGLNELTLPSTIDVLVGDFVNIGTSHPVGVDGSGFIGATSVANDTTLRYKEGIVGVDVNYDWDAQSSLAYHACVQLIGTT